MSEAAPEGNQEASDAGQMESSYSPPATQADLDRIIQDRLSRHDKKYADYEDLKTKAAEAEKHAEANKSEQQKAIDAAREEGANEVTGKFTTKLVNADIRATAATLGFSDPKDAIALYGDISEVEIGEDGPDGDAIKARLEKIAEEKPYLLKATGSKPARRPSPARGEESDAAPTGSGKGKAASALRQLGAARKSQ
ncbi:hypothetical protein [Pseudarthrobacter sp. PS3-L1]|uniref:hypothetical protein n=1 Tax=Pseudarthrobacter sp. PS3-L1 TaxID=3046207 RepID=UPI0024B97AF1|nr:hypothetical protein [Pseudarthrobacter sp. PS3-L1]MDJ0321665.1 hypothetical protein [Pseudarthrobacter sp. PS3-L1]